MLVQLYFLVIIITLISQRSSLFVMEFFFLRLGILSSQIFLLEFAFKHLNKFIYNRATNISFLRQSASRLPIIGSLYI